MLADDQGNRITYGEFEKIYEERSKFLEEGRLAFLYCRNTVGAVLYYRSCLRNHVVPLLLEHRMDRELLRTLIGTYEPDYLIGVLWLSACKAGCQTENGAESGACASPYDLRQHGKPEACKTEPEKCYVKCGVDRGISGA